MIGFQLGREFKLSVAEILTVFPLVKTVYFDKQIIIIDNLSKDKVIKKANLLGGTIKIIEILDDSIIKDAINHEGKFKYGISVFGEKKSLRNILINLRKTLKNKGISSRFVNKDFKNLSSAQILGEKLLKTGTDYNYVYFNKNTYFGKTIWVQNINEYSKRDYSKNRDMQIGMLPPKLCQIMINISGGKNIYDPFVGLGTLLIEAILSGKTSVFGSDLNKRMVEAAINNINNFISDNNIKLDDFNVIKLNAKFINESEILLNKNIESIVSEGYLGEIMTKKNISIDRIKKQRRVLSLLYERFFNGLSKINYSGNIVICFPFWEIKGKYFYLEEIYEILKKYCEVEKIFPKDFKEISTTKVGSLLYKREKQLVGREIFKLKVKKL